MKELGDKWIEQLLEYISDNPQFIFKRFVWSGISLAPDGLSIEEDPEEDTSDGDHEENDDKRMMMTKKLETKKKLVMKKRLVIKKKLVIKNRLVIMTKI